MREGDKKRERKRETDRDREMWSHKPYNVTSLPEVVPNKYVIKSGWN